MSETPEHTNTTTHLGMCPPSKWTCPKCGQSVTTHVRTLPVVCRNDKHRREAIIMTATKLAKQNKEES